MIVTEQTLQNNNAIMKYKEQKIVPEIERHETTRAILQLLVWSDSKTRHYREPPSSLNYYFSFKHTIYT